MIDVFFLSCREPNADANWERLKSRIPSAKRVDNIPGILAAHRRCADLAETDYFFVVDGDNEVFDDFAFQVPDALTEEVLVWRARNPLNGLEYGWGGIKLFPRHLLVARDTMGMDMTMGFPFLSIQETASVTRFNSSPLLTWRSAFRESVKLIHSIDPAAPGRLDVWCNIAEGEFSDYCLSGARTGRRYALSGGDRLRINDFDWLETIFRESDHG